MRHDSLQSLLLIAHDDSESTYDMHILSVQTLSVFLPREEDEGSPFASQLRHTTVVLDSNLLAEVCVHVGGMVEAPRVYRPDMCGIGNRSEERRVGKEC